MKADAEKIKERPDGPLLLLNDSHRIAARDRKTQLLAVIVVVTNVVGNVCLSRGMQQVGRTVSASPLDYLGPLMNPWVFAGTCTLAIWMISDLALLSRADLTFVLPVTASAYIFISIAGHFLLGDRISWQHWLGIIVITLAVILAEETPSLTAGQPQENQL